MEGLPYSLPLVNLSTSPTLPFSKSLRAASTAAHGGAEQSSYLASLLGGGARHARLRAARLAAPAHLPGPRGAADGLAGDPVAGPFVFEELRRLPSLEADLEALLGAGWRDQAVAVPRTGPTASASTRWEPPGPAASWPTTTCATWATCPGGIFIGRKVEEIYDIEGHAGTSFYVFAGIPDPMAFKDRYRGLLDTAPWDDAERGLITEEMLEGYHCNTEVLEELGRWATSFTPDVVEAVMAHMNGDHADDCVVICRVLGGRPGHDRAADDRHGRRRDRVRGDRAGRRDDRAHPVRRAPHRPGRRCGPRWLGMYHESAAVLGLPSREH